MRSDILPRLRAYGAGAAAGALIGLLVLGGVVAVKAWRERGPVTGGPGGELELQAPPVDAATLPFGTFGICVQERLEDVASAGDETEDEMLAAQQACLGHLDGDAPAVSEEE